MPEESGDLTAETLLAAAQEYDASVEAGETPEVEVKTEEPETEETPETGSEPEIEPDSEPQDVDEPDSSLTEGEPPEVKEGEPDKSKWAKNEARKNKSWKEINSRKEENKREREAIETERQELAERQADLDDGKSYRDEKGFTAEDYESAAERLESDGDSELAVDARDKAESVRMDGQKTEQDRAVRKTQDDWESVREELMGDTPELKDPDNHLTKTANQILKDYPDLLYVPEGKGLRHAVQIARWKVASEGMDKSQAEVTELKEKLDKLEKITSVDGGYSSDKPSGEKGFDDLSDDEQESYLRRAAAQLDDAM
jgi:hypothetical protein